MMTCGEGGKVQLTYIDVKEVHVQKAVAEIHSTHSLCQDLCFVSLQ